MSNEYQYPTDQTAVLMVDPLNEFFSSKGKLGEMTRDVVEKTATVENLARLANVARSRGAKIITAGDF